MLSREDDGTNQIADGTDETILATVKAASTAAVSTDKSIVTALNPNTPLPAGSNLLGTVNVIGTGTNGNQIDGFGRLRIADTDLIESLHFANSSHPLLVSSSLTGSGTAALSSANSSLRLSTTTNAADSVIVQSRRYFRYNPGRSYIVTVSGNLGAKKTNTRQRVGYFDATNGIFFEQTGTDFAVVVRTDASGAAVDTRVLQASWNIDKLDGTGTSGVTLDPSKHNLYVMDFLWHGAGVIRFGIIYNGQILYCHKVENANTRATPFMRTPCLPLRIELVNTGTVANSTNVDLVCFAFQKESSDNIASPYSFSVSTGRTAVSVAATTLPIISIRPKLTFNSLTNRVPIVPAAVSAVTNSQNVLVSLVLNATLTGASFSSADTNSAVEFDIAATAVSGGTIIHQFYVANTGSLLGGSGSTGLSSILDIILGLNIAGGTADILTMTAQSTAGGTNTYGQIGWQEYQ